MPITTIYRATVEVPDHLVEMVGRETPRWNHLTNRMAQAADASGATFYAEHLEWAEFSRRGPAELFEQQWAEAISLLQREFEAKQRGETLPEEPKIFRFPTHLEAHP